MKRIDMNVVERYKPMMLDDIKADLNTKRADFTSVFLNLTHDFNKSVGVRNHNAFAGKDIWFVGKKQWDKRGAVGTYHYEDIHYADCWDTFLLYKPDGPIVCVENVGGAKQVSLGSFDIPSNAIFVYGEEKAGTPQYVLDSADYILDIPMWGSVRSLNVSVSSGIVMYEYRRQHSL
jgi:tRNA(Leu) C34 or U34 (ribose-2'-O)-methylase TrmL